MQTRKDSNLNETHRHPDAEDIAMAAATRASHDPFPVSTIWVTPDGDSLIAYQARVSNPKATKDDPSSRLIGYLIRNHHWSPFQMANLCVEINTTRDISAQIIRHQSAHFQEFSTRYADVESLIWFRECRFQDDKNRQNSFTADQVHDADDSPDKMMALDETVAYWDALVNEARVRSEEGYAEARRRGVAKEVARTILPIGLIPTKLYMNGTVRTWMHYLFERTKPGVQKEHRDIALKIELIFKEAFPDTYEAYLAWKTEERRKQKLWDLFTSKNLHYHVSVFGETTYFYKGLSDVLDE